MGIPARMGGPILAVAMQLALAGLHPLGAQQVPARVEVTAPPAIVAGRIVGPDKKGLADVEIVLGDTRKEVTDRKGRFEFDPVSPGVHDVFVRKIGFVPLRFRLAVTAGDVWDGTITMDRTVQSLPEVVVLDSAKALRNFRPSWLDAFLDRRRLGFGTFFDRIEIEDSHTSRLVHLLARVPGITATEGFGYDQLHVSRCSAVAGPSKQILFVDGIKMETSYTGRFATLAEYLPDQVWGLEIYRGRGAIPAQYDDPQACLVILMWTNHR